MHLSAFVPATPLLLVFLTATTTVGQAKIPEEIAHLAAIHSCDYYQNNNMPFHYLLAGSFEARMESLRVSSLPGLSERYLELRSAREKLFLLDAAYLAVASETPFGDAMNAMSNQWLADPGARHDFATDVGGGYAARLQQLTDLARLSELEQEPRETIARAWSDFSSALQDLDTLESPPVSVDFGFIQNIGFGVVRNRSGRDLSNLILCFRSVAERNAKRESVDWVYFVPMLKENETIVFSHSSLRWPVSWTEMDPSRFNAALQNGTLSIVADVYCDAGRSVGVLPDFRDGLRLRMEFLKTVLSGGSVFRSMSGGQIVIDRSSASGSTMNLRVEGGYSATLNTRWHGDQLFTDFEPNSTAFRIRLVRPRSATRNGNRDIPAPMRGLTDQGSACYTWRGGMLYSEPVFGGATAYYPFLGTTPDSENDSADEIDEPEPRSRIEQGLEVLGVGAIWRGSITYYDQQGRFGPETTYVMTRRNGASFSILDESTGSLEIDGHRILLTLEITGNEVKATLKEQEPPLFGPSLLPGEWIGIRRGTRLTLRREVKVPPTSRVKTEAITLRFDDSPSAR